MEFIEQPPANKRSARSTHWAAVVAELKANPAKWAFVGTYSPGIATHMRHGRYVAFLDGHSTNSDEARAYMSSHWEIATRMNEKRNDIYIRWIG